MTKIDSDKIARAFLLLSLSIWALTSNQKEKQRIRIQISLEQKQKKRFGFCLNLNSTIIAISTHFAICFVKTIFLQFRMEFYASLTFHTEFICSFKYTVIQFRRRQVSKIYE